MQKPFHELFEIMQEQRRQVEEGNAPTDHARMLIRQKLRRANGCPDEEALHGIVDGQLRRTSVRHWLKVVWHVRVTRCQFCRGDLEDVEGLVAAVRHFQRDQPQPGPAAGRSWAGRVLKWMAKGPSMVPPPWAIASVIGLLLLSLTLSAGRAWWPFMSQVTMAVSYSGAELIGITEVVRQPEGQPGATAALRHTEPSNLVRHLEEMVATDTMQWDVISVDIDSLGILVQKGLVEDLSKYGYRPSETLLRDELFRSLRERLRVGGRDYRDYFVPFRPNVKLTYYNQDTLLRAGHSQPPATWNELEQLARDLAANSPASGGRVAIQAHPGKAAAATMFEFVTAMGGDPLALDDNGARQAFTRLWNLAPFLDPASTTIQFDSANEMLINDEVALVSNWTYGIKVVIENAKKTDIRVAPGRLEGGYQVLGGDVLAIPTGAPNPKQAIKLIERLVDKPTQRALAENLFWAPVRDDVYAELPPQDGRKERFQMIREALQTAVMRPPTPEWILVEEVLSDALQEVLRQGAKGKPATEEAIEELLRPYVDRLKKIPRQYIACREEMKKTSREGRCGAIVQGKKSFEELASIFNTTPAILAKVNGRRDRDPVNPKNMPYLLVPEPVPGH